MTASSIVVEGSTSLLFTLVLAALFMVVPADFDTAILASQALALAGLATTALLLGSRLKEAGTARPARLLILAAFLLLPAHLNEVQNGMEMTWFAALLLLMVLLFDRGSYLAIFVIPLLLMVRFEAAGYLLFAFLALFVFDREYRMAHVVFLVTTIVSIVALAAGRFWMFGDVVPNGVWAGLTLPHDGAAALAGLSQFLGETFELILIAVLLAAVFRGTALLRDVKFWLAVGFAAFALIAGPFEGHAGRMALALLPVLIVFVIEQVDLPEDAAPAMAPAGRAPFWAALIAIAATAIGSVESGRKALEAATHGGVAQGLITEAVAAQAGIVSARPATDTAAAAHQAAEALARLQGVLGTDITILTHKIAGLGLCCDGVGLRVLDLTPVANPDMARGGYSGFADWLAAETPDVIVASGPWAERSGLYTSGVLAEGYHPLIHAEMLLWLRSDHYSALAERPGTELRTVRKSDVPALIATSLDTEDIDYLRALPRPVEALTLAPGAHEMARMRG
ncbi:MAG: hypothetical protein AAF771_08015 [Pseudomonadota bacterium]